MIRKFSISGLYSFGDDLQVVDFTAKGKSRLLNTKYEYNFNLNQADRPMKSAVFFGRNASGKTNLFLGFNILLNIIKSGFSNTKNEYISSDAFNKNVKTITLGIEISNNKNDIFNYDIVFDKESVLGEKLFKNGNQIFILKNKKALFSTSDLTINEPLRSFFSRKLSNNIFHTIKDFQLEEIKEFYQIISNVEIYMSSSYSRSYNVFFPQTSRNYFIKNKGSMLEIFQILDKSIDDFGFKEELDKAGKNIYKLFFIRNNQQFNYKEESEGIKKIIQLAIELVEVVKNSKILVIDEFDSSISTMALIKIFNNIINTPENKNGQLIVSSHNVLLFDISFLNSQQIFLIQKNDKLETFIHTYYDYDIKSEKKRSYIKYLQGCFDE